MKISYERVFFNLRHYLYNDDDDDDKSHDDGSGVASKWFYVVWFE